MAVMATAAALGHAAVRQLTAAELRPDQELPADVEAEVDAVWDRFLAVFGSRRHCFDDLALRLVPEVDGGDARYLVAEARIEIEIPTSPARFRDSLAHELAHHVEHTCGAFGDLRRELASLPELRGRDWDDPELPWEERPTELWAETVVELVTGDRVRTARRFDLPAGAGASVSAWAADG